LEVLSDDKDIKRAWENIKENIKTSAKQIVGLHELKQHKSWFDEECLASIDKRKQAKMDLTHDQSQNNVDNMNNVGHEARIHFRNKRRHNRKLKVRNLKLRIRSKLLGSCIGKSVISRSVTILELI